MEWEFTPQQVVKAEVEYGLGDFRRDLLLEVRSNVGGDDADTQATCELLFDLCYWLATEKDFDAFVAGHAHSPPTCEFLRSVGEAMTPNAEMLGAILQRMIMSEVERGAVLEEGLGNVHRTVQQVTSDIRH